MAASEQQETPPSPPADANETVAEEVEEEPEPEGPDLSSLGPDARALLDTMLEALEEFDPQPGAMSDIPQVTVSRQYIVDACRTMKEDERIRTMMLLCLSAVDYSETLQMVYFLQSLGPERTVVIKTEAPTDDPVVPSVTGLWKAADWYEREAHDLFGVSFEGHPDLSPLLLYDEFEGYPGRKEYPFYEYREF